MSRTKSSPEVKAPVAASVVSDSGRQPDAMVEPQYIENASAGGMRPSPIPGMSMQDFRNFLTRALSGDESVPSAILTRVNSVLIGQGSEAKEKDKKWWERMILQQIIREHLREIDAYIEALNRRAEELRYQIGENKAKIVENSEWIKETDRRHKGAAEGISFYEKNGYFERGEDGKLKNKDAQKILDDYIKRTGTTPESDTAIELAIRRQMEIDQQEALRRKQENDGLGIKISKDEKELTEVEKAAKEAVEKRNEIERIYKDNPDLAQQKIDEFWKETKAKKYTGFEGDKVLDKARENSNNIVVQSEIDKAQTSKETAQALQEDQSDVWGDQDLNKKFAAAAQKPQPSEFQVANEAKSDFQNTQKFQPV